MTTTVAQDTVRPLPLIAALLTICLSGHARAAEPTPPAADDVKALVKDYAFGEKPKLNSATEFKIEEYAIDGLKALDVRILLARYFAPDGKQFNEALLVLHAGKLTPLAPTTGGHGLMSAVVSNGKLYYTYSWGSGRHRSHLGQLTAAKAKLTVVQSSPLYDADCFVTQDANGLYLERGAFEKFNAWKPDQRYGEIKPKDPGFTVVTKAGEEIQTFTK
jgi:hypothetical protein